MGSIVARMLQALMFSVCLYCGSTHANADVTPSSRVSIPHGTSRALKNKTQRHSVSPRQLACTERCGKVLLALRRRQRDIESFWAVHPTAQLYARELLTSNSMGCPRKFQTELGKYTVMYCIYTVIVYIRVQLPSQYLCLYS